MAESAPVPDEELASLRRRVAELEAERDRYAQQNAELFVLQQIFSTMNSSLDSEDILATVLRGVHETLHFGRVVLFDVRDGVASRRLETGPQGDVVASPTRETCATPCPSWPWSAGRPTSPSGSPTTATAR